MPAQWVARAVYGLPEVYREQVKGAQLIANPGCYPTAVQLGFLPLVKAGLVDCGEPHRRRQVRRVGAGRKAETHILFRGRGQFQGLRRTGPSASAGNPPGSRSDGGCSVGLTFVPHLTPMIRGIHATSMRGSAAKLIFRPPSKPVMPPSPLWTCCRRSLIRDSFGPFGQRLPHCGASSPGRRHPGGPVGHRQPGQRRGRAGGPEHEHHVRSGRNPGPMPTPAVTLKLRRFRRRFGITAPRVAVRTPFPGSGTPPACWR